MSRLIVVVGVASGVGKTTVTLGLMEAFRRRGLAVQGFKIGPDFIDPGFHEIATGRPSYNLDGWMCGRDHVLATVARHAEGADLAIVEGVMGCFDGVEATSDEGSTAQIAKWLEAPVVLVVDAQAQARSAAAVVLGFEQFDPATKLAAVIVNKVAGDRHARGIREAVAMRCTAPVVGALPHDAQIALSERHLGLVTAGEGGFTEAKRAQLAAVTERAVDLDALLALAVPAPRTIDVRSSPIPAVRRVRLGVAHDDAFCFYYRENLALLRAAGADLVYWSPLTDRALPPVDGLYLGGGYPELHGQALGANAAMRRAVRDFAEGGGAVYAECGGLMYLAEALEDLAGDPFPMVGLLPATVRMRPRRMTLSYTEVTLQADSPLGAAGTLARGHEFHFSTLDPVPPSVERVYRLRRRGGDEGVEGYRIGNALLSYVHLHFGSNPELAAGLVRACARRVKP
ncbi:MAG TPA: cobyrinate a,c-diamide synthase [Methylomirabilota bacterium]|nr:cobyrinate a,c-diamide synthase [Methylomirabilota bacterium]